MDTTERLHFHFSLSCIGEGKKPRTPLSSRVATRVSWSPLSGLKGVQPPLPFGHGGGSARPRVPRPGGSPSAGLDWWSRGEGKLRILRAVGVGRGSGWKKGAAGRSRAPHCAAPGSPAAPRSVPAAPGPPSAGFAARSVSLSGPRSVVASVDRQARSKRLTCSASGVLRPGAPCSGTGSPALGLCSP